LTSFAPRKSSLPPNRVQAGISSAVAAASPGRSIVWWLRGGAWKPPRKASARASISEGKSSAASISAAAK
jgi:hypothetical protein